MPRSRIFWVLLGLLIGLGAFALGVSCTLRPAALPAKEPDPQLEGLPPEFSRLAEVWELLQKEHVTGGKLDADLLSAGAVRGMMLALDDPYASFLDAKQYGVERQDLEGFFEGIGAQVAMRDGRVSIIAPLPGTPAERAGIQPGDLILEINGQTTNGLTLLEAVSKIRGPKGTIVELLVFHLEAKEPVLVSVERAVIKLDSVRLKMLPGGIGHLRISEFSETTNDELKAALEEFRKQQGKGLVLDLRNNPGGLLNSVVDVASQFLDSGLVLYELDAHGNRDDWKVRSGGRAKDIPTVVIINQFSASASEVLSGALMDHQRATIIGATSFGKGSVNTLRRLDDGSGVYFTIAHWYTPKGTLIEGKGITPEIVVETPPTLTEDAQLARALEALQQRMAQASPQGSK
ncbi:MAG: S41 family peptidase [Dehalococcoidia bacterium]|nr:S41 family peptidase [Dehalococcoidia bacterium]MSQ17035.1 S41 family peptidase [Dehalococcoidia bacterium]